jgi:hypothetical protein
MQVVSGLGYPSRVMRHRSLRRFGAALLNLLFLLAWGEPVTLHPCPTHDAVSGMAVSGMAAHQAHQAENGHEAMAASAGHAQHAEHEGGHVCSCLGTCAVGVAVAAPTAQAVRWQVVVRRRVAPIEPAADAPLAAAPRLLPFANGPPRTA